MIKRRERESNFLININDAFNSNNGYYHVFSTDKNNNLIQCNQLQFEVFTHINGIKNYKDIVGLHMLDLMSKDAAELVSTENEKVMTTGQAQQFYNRWTILGYKQITLMTIKMPLYDNNGKIAGVFGIANYLTVCSLENVQPFQLTKREKQCLNYLLQGYTIKEIANQIHLSPRTIEFYLANIKSKLGANTKSDLIKKVKDLGTVWDKKRDHVISIPFVPDQDLIEY